MYVCLCACVNKYLRYETQMTYIAMHMHRVEMNVYAMQYDISVLFSFWQDIWPGLSVPIVVSGRAKTSKSSKHKDVGSGLMGEHLCYGGLSYKAEPHFQMDSDSGKSEK